MKLLQHRVKDGYGIVYIHESKKLINFKESGELTNHTNSKILHKKSYYAINFIKTNNFIHKITNKIIQKL